MKAHNAPQRDNSLNSDNHLENIIKAGTEPDLIKLIMILEVDSELPKVLIKVLFLGICDTEQVLPGKVSS